MCLKADENPEALPKWNFYLPDEDRSSGWSNHTYCLQFVCEGYGHAAQAAAGEAVMAGRVPEGFLLPEGVVAIRDDFEGSATLEGPKRPLRRVPLSA
jgi:hypothetical protein